MTARPPTHGLLRRGRARTALGSLVAAALALPLSSQATPNVSITATPAAVAYGGTSTLSWTATNATLCAIPWGSSATSGSYSTPALFGTASYTITCYGPTGSKSATTTVTVAGPPPAPTVNLTATPATVVTGASSTLAWSSTHATSCNTPWGATATQGVHLTAPITYEQTFTVTCSGYGGSNAAAVTVRIGAGPLPAPPVVTLSASPGAVAYNGTTTLSWSSSNATGCSTPWGSTALAGSHATPPLTTTTTYTVTCTGSGGTGSASATVTVGPAPPPAPTAPVVSLSANPASVTVGASSTLSWSSTNSTSCTTPGGSTASSGSYTTPPLTASTSFVVTCTGPGGSGSASVTVGVVTPAPPTSGVGVTLLASPTTVAYGSTSQLSWSSSNATFCAVPWGSSATSGSYTTPALFGPSTYIITCYGPAGSQSASVTVSVTGPPPAATVALSANPATVANGASSTLSWASTDANSCNTPWGSTATSGVHATPPITYEQTFTVTCSGYGGSGAASVTVRIGSGTQPAAPTLMLTALPASIATGATSTLSWASTGATACVAPWGSVSPSGSYVATLLATTTFTLTCTGPGGSRSESVTVAVAPAPPLPPVPTVALSANPASVALGSTTTLSWSSTNATACSTPWGATQTAGTYTTPALTSATSYAVSCTGAGGTGTASVTVVVAPGSPPDAPSVFNATASARPGDVVSLQGENLGPSPVVVLDSAPSVPLQIVNRVGTGWLAVRIPAAAQGALTLRVSNGTATSAPVKLNAAIPLHLDAIQLVPGGAFRVFGRNLLLPGSTPTIRLNGIPAAVTLSSSDEHMLSATVPTTLAPTANVSVLVDNGNGSGPALLDRSIEVVASGAGDPFALGVGWAAGFSDLATRVIDAATDTRLSPKVVCNDAQDDAPALQQAVQLAHSLGGAVVRLPPGRCRLGSSVILRSKVVVQGAGKALTQLIYAANYPVYGVGLDLAGLRNLALINAGPATEGPLLKQSTRVFLQNVRVVIGTSRQMYLDGNRNVVITGSDFVQSGSISDQGPYTLYDSAGLVFQGNTTRWVGGAPAFGRVHDSYVHDNRFTRDGSAQQLDVVVHSLTVDFAYRLALVGNTLDVANGPITNTGRNDGEAILTEGGGTQRTENLGNVGSATSHTLSDPANTLMTDPFGNGYMPENYGVAIVGGKGAGQTRRVVSYSWPTLTVDRAWDVIPDPTSRYATFVWGLEKSLIKNNTLSQNPRGLWLYQTGVRDVDVIGNSFSEGGGIYLRAFQNLATKTFTPIYNVLIARNRISNSTRNWMSYLNAVFVNADARAFGIAFLGLEMRANEITANQPNVESQTEEYANVEGFMNMMRVENFSGYESSPLPRLLGTILSGNRCTHCGVAVRIGTGAGGTTVLDTVRVDSPVLLTDSATTVTSEKATDTVVLPP